MKRMICAAALILSLCRLALPVSAMELDVAGKSAVLMDVATGTILYESNSHEHLAPASVTKVMTMLLIMEAVDSGKIALTDMVTASETAAAKGGQSDLPEGGGDHARFRHAQIHRGVLGQRLRLRHGGAYRGQ